MIFNPDSFLDEFAEAGSDSFLVHWEGNNNLSRTVERSQSTRQGRRGSHQPGNSRRGPGGNPARRRPGVLVMTDQSGVWPSAFHAQHDPGKFGVSGR